MLPDPKKANNLEELAERLGGERQKVLSLLSEKKWFRHTKFDLQKEILTLPEDFDGYLVNLTTRKEMYGEMDVLKLTDIQRGNFNIISVFQVRSHHNNQLFTYEYTSSKYGKNPGYRGLIFLEIKGEIKYFVLRYTEKFAIGRGIYETIGGYLQFKDNRLINLPTNIEKSLKKQLGMKELVIKRFIDLGLLAPDPAVTNNTTSLFAAVIAIEDFQALEKLEKKLFHTKPLSFELSIEPIEAIQEFINKTDESFFLACVARLLSIGFIEL